MTKTLVDEINRSPSFALMLDESTDITATVEKRLSICVNMFGSRGGTGVQPPPPLKNHKNIGFLSNTGLDPLKTTKLPSQADLQCWAIISTPAKRHLNGISLADGDDGPLIVVFVVVFGS